jgi:hypothetical protein
MDSITEEIARRGTLMIAPASGSFQALRSSSLPAEAR